MTCPRSHANKWGELGTEYRLPRARTCSPNLHTVTLPLVQAQFLHHKSFFEALCLLSPPSFLELEGAIAVLMFQFFTRAEFAAHNGTWLPL